MVDIEVLRQEIKGMSRRSKIYKALKWELKDTGTIRLPKNESFVSFIKIKDKLLIISNKAIYQLKPKK